MIKKILPISVFVLIFILILLAVIQLMLRNNPGNQNGNVITPTLFQGRQINIVTPKNGKNGRTYPPNVSPGNSAPTEVTQSTPEEFQKKLPIVAPEFTLSYSPRMQKYVASLNNNEVSKLSYDEWVVQNPSFQQELQVQNVIIAQQSLQELEAVLNAEAADPMTPEKKAIRDTKALNDIITNVMNLPQKLMDIQTTPLPSQIPSPSPKPQSKTPPHSSSGLTYYSQCGLPYGSYLLPIQDCSNGPATVCKSGCGPTTAAMIISSYVDSTQTPPVVVEAMNKAGIEIKCRGTDVVLYDYMAKVNGLKVTTPVFYNWVTYNDLDLQKDFKKYMDGGYTIFVLAYYVSNDGLSGHYFWATEISEEGHILAYDPFYGQGRPTPFNESKNYPLTQYRWAFGVKKS